MALLTCCRILVKFRNAVKVIFCLFVDAAEGRLMSSLSSADVSDTYSVVVID